MIGNIDRHPKDGIRYARGRSVVTTTVVLTYSTFSVHSQMLDRLLIQRVPSVKTTRGLFLPVHSASGPPHIVWQERLVPMLDRQLILRVHPLWRMSEGYSPSRLIPANDASNIVWIHLVVRSLVRTTLLLCRKVTRLIFRNRLP